MIAGNQRWREGRDSYVPPDEVINTRLYEVALVDETPAKAFVVDHHYSGSFPAARVRVGLYRAGRLVGVAIFSEPVNSRTVPKWAGPGAVGCELGRFVLLDDVPGNGETWFLARAKRLLLEERPDFRWVVSFADPHERFTTEGVLVKPGHVGTIYQASSAKYCGRSARNTIYLTSGGVVVSHRTLSKVRGGESGQTYAAEQLVRAGAPRRLLGESGPSYITRVLKTLRRQRHPGNHVYLFHLQRQPRNLKTYPKAHAA